MKVIWRKGQIPSCWQRAEGCFVPKVENSQTIGQFRTISLLNVEGKIFSVLALRMTSYMTGNQYVDTAVQKGGIPGFSGCIEHVSIISQLIGEAKVNKQDLTVVWLDLVNAYGTIPHSLIETALKQNTTTFQIMSSTSSAATLVGSSCDFLSLTIQHLGKASKKALLQGVPSL